jgi:cellulose synthase/poly-beta-1,6-N-acetylglucosamine synthase-like glycosyltransferase
VIFRRDALVSLGGQAYGSITEDNYTSMKMCAAGFKGMYLNERLMYGMVSEHG